MAVRGNDTPVVVALVLGIGSEIQVCCLAPKDTHRVSVGISRFHSTFFPTLTSKMSQPLSVTGF
uniref:Uncharacterized protein n=1 Tax=Anguilla anguilla TaxID=7936 RepID=A0A0E9Q3S3_ANGAN